MFLDYFALGLVIFVVLFIFYAIIGIHDIPYEISVKRNHPHQDAIHVTGWVSMFTLHAIWPFLWIWATLYREDRGWGFGSTPQATGGGDLEQRVRELTERVDHLHAQLGNAGETGKG